MSDHNIIDVGALNRTIVQTLGTKGGMFARKDGKCLKAIIPVNLLPGLKSIPPMMSGNVITSTIGCHHVSCKKENNSFRISSSNQSAMEQFIILARSEATVDELR